MIKPPSLRHITPPATAATHELKCWPEPFAAVRARKKPFEFRKDDREYSVGDELLLMEFDPALGAFSGEWELTRVTYILRAAFGLPPGFVVMGLAYIENNLRPTDGPHS